MWALIFYKQQEMETIEYTKNVLMKSLTLFAKIYQMHAVLILLITHEKQKFGNIILWLVKENRKF